MRNNKKRINVHNKRTTCGKLQQKFIKNVK